MPNATAILLYWKRPLYFNMIVENLANEPEVNEVIVFNNNPEAKLKKEDYKIPEGTDLVIISSSKNFGAGVRMNIASMAKNDYIIYCDDDTIPYEGVTKDFLKYIGKYGFVGTHGKLYRNHDYFDKKTVTADSVEKPVFVDYLCYNFSMINRRIFSILNLNEVDLFYLDDLWLSMKLRKMGYSLPVIPTNRFRITDLNLDNNALNRNKESQKIRAEFLLSYKDKLEGLLVE